MNRIKIICVFFSALWIDARAKDDRKGVCTSEGNITQCCIDYTLVNNECQECPAGTFGSGCTQNCESGYYGKFCKKQCKCTTNEVCNPKTGCGLWGSEKDSSPGKVKGSSRQGSGTQYWRVVAIIVCVCFFVCITGVSFFLIHRRPRNDGRGNSEVTGADSEVANDEEAGQHRGISTIYSEHAEVSELYDFTDPDDTVYHKLKFPGLKDIDGKSEVLNNAYVSSETLMAKMSLEKDIFSCSFPNCQPQQERDRKRYVKNSVAKKKSGELSSTVPVTSRYSLANLTFGNKQRQQDNVM